MSLVEGVLQRDPAGVYGAMDFLSRDRYRQAVEDLADGTGEGQLRVALRAVESARQAAEAGGAGRAVHVGHHLIGRGRADLEADVAYRPRLLRRARRFVFAHATAAYLGTIVFLTALLLGLGFGYAHRHADTPWPQTQYWAHKMFDGVPNDVAEKAAYRNAERIFNWTSAELSTVAAVAA